MELETARLIARLTKERKESKDDNLRHAQVVQTHRRMLPQFAALQVEDYAAPKGRGEGSGRIRKDGAGA